MFARLLQSRTTRVIATHRAFSTTPCVRAASNAGGAQMPKLSWIKADHPSNPFRVPLLDCRPITTTMLSTSSDPRMAANALSYEADGSGICFLHEFQQNKAEYSKWTSGECQLRFRRDRYLADGSMFTPRAMEDKWYLTFHDSKIFFLRSWQRQIQFVAHVKQSAKALAAASEDDYVDIVGWEARNFPDADRDITPRSNERAIDFMLRNLACREDYPAPLHLNGLRPKPPHTTVDPSNYEETAETGFAGVMNWSYYGRAANYCTPSVIEPRTIPKWPLRTWSKAFFALRDKQYAEFDRLVASGYPVDLRTPEATALTPLALFALGGQAPDGGSLTATAEHLIKSDHPIDSPDHFGSTPLMTAISGFEYLPRDDPNPSDVAAAKAKGLPPPLGALKPPPPANGGQYSHIAHMKLFIAHGANVNATDVQGGTALHRAAACGDAAAVRVLLDAGARKDATVELDGVPQTPIMIARKLKHSAEVLAMLQ